MTFLTAITFLCAALYLVCACLTALGKARRLLVVVYAAAFGINLLLVARNAVVNGYVPFVSMYQVLTFLAAMMTLSAVYMCLIKRQSAIFKFFPFISGIILIGVCFMSSNGRWHFPPALNSPFFVPHVLMYMISYTLCAVSFAVCLSGMLMKKRQTEYGDACVLLVKTALPFMLSGMLLGAAWANEVWGEFWSWDIKECFSLITLLFYGGYLHMVKLKRLGGLSKAFLLLGFAALVFTLLFVNLIPSDSLHAYSQ